MKERWRCEIRTIFMTWNVCHSPSATAVFVKITDGIKAQRRKTLLVFLPATSTSSALEVHSARRTQLDVTISDCVVVWVTTQCQDRLYQCCKVWLWNCDTCVWTKCWLRHIIWSHLHTYAFTYLVGLYCSPQILHPFVSLRWWTARKTFGSRGGGDLPPWHRKKENQCFNHQSSCITINFSNLQWQICAHITCTREFLQ